MPFLGPALDRAPRAILFDIGRVIVPIDTSRSTGTLGNHGAFPGYSPNILRELEADSRWPDWQEGRMTPREWHAHLVKKLPFPADFDEFCAIWNSALVPGTILPETVFERLAQSCRLALLSNTDPIHIAHLEANFSFVRHFPARVYSCRIGSSKPQPAIYLLALREVGALPQESMFIDDVRENADAAARLGIHAFHFTSAEELLTEFSRLGLWDS